MSGDLLRWDKEGTHCLMCGEPLDEHGQSLRGCGYYLDALSDLRARLDLAENALIDARTERDMQEAYERDLLAQNARLGAALVEARANIADWASYADQYFIDRHDLAGDLAAIDAVLGESGGDK